MQTTFSGACRPGHYQNNSWEPLKISVKSFWKNFLEVHGGRKLPPTGLLLYICQPWPGRMSHPLLRIWAWIWASADPGLALGPASGRCLVQGLGPEARLRRWLWVFINLGSQPLAAWGESQWKQWESENWDCVTDDSAWPTHLLFLPSLGKGGALCRGCGSRVVSLRESESLHCGSSLWESVFFEPVNLESWSLTVWLREAGLGTGIVMGSTFPILPSCVLVCGSGPRLMAMAYLETWLILPVVICLSQRLSHACLSISFYTAKLRMAH